MILREVPKTLANAFELLTQPPADFFSDTRKGTPPQERDSVNKATYLYPHWKRPLLSISIIRKRSMHIGNFQASIFNLKN